jgi:hypothetical protein
MARPLPQGHGPSIRRKNFLFGFAILGGNLSESIRLPIALRLVRRAWSIEIQLLLQLVIPPYGGGGGIRTRDTVSRIHTFQACAFSRSATPPRRAFDASSAHITVRGRGASRQASN